jgi:hypothetical protein
MRKLAPQRMGLVAMAAFWFLAVAFPATVHAVVGDVTLTGLPPETTITLTDEKTGQKAEGKTDDRGIVVIPLGGRKWNAGSYTATARNPSMFPGTPSRRIELKDGSNRVDLSGLVPFASGVVPGRTPSMPYSVVDLHVGWRFFDLAPVGPSLALRADYTPPVAFNEDMFTLRPYAGLWGVPSVNVTSHRPYDNGSFQFRVKSGSMFGLNAGLKHVSDLRKWGLVAPDPGVSILGIIGAGIGWLYYCFDTERVDISPDFAKAHDGFRRSAHGFRMELNTGIAISKDNYFVGVKGGVAPTVTNVLNLDTQLRWEGNISFVGGWRF